MRPAALTMCAVFLLGLIVLPFAPETVNKPLPEDEKDLFFSATVRHLTEQASRSGLRQWRVGIVFEDLPAVGQNRIQRYIDRVERERRELS